MDFEALAKDRYSCRKMSDRPVESEKLEAVLRAGLAAPTAKNNQPYKVWAVTSPEGVEKINSVTSCGFGAGTFLVVGGRADEAWVRPFDGKNFADVDASIAATHLMLAIHDAGLRSTWVGFFDAPALKKLFPEMEAYELIAIFPVGYPAEDAGPSPRHSERRDIPGAVSFI